MVAEPGEYEAFLRSALYIDVHAQGSDSGSLNLDLGYGYYLTPGWQIGIRQGLNYNFIDDSRDSVLTAPHSPAA